MENSLHFVEQNNPYKAITKHQDYSLFYSRIFAFFFRAIPLIIITYICWSWVCYIHYIHNASKGIYSSEIVEKEKFCPWELGWSNKPNENRKLNSVLDNEHIVSVCACNVKLTLNKRKTSFVSVQSSSRFSFFHRLLITLIRFSAHSTIIAFTQKSRCSVLCCHIVNSLQSKWV